MNLKSIFTRNKKQPPTAKYLLEEMKCIAYIEQFSSKGLIRYDLKERKVVLSSTLMAPFMKHDDKLNNFMRHVLYWLNFNAANEAARRLPLKEKEDPNRTCNVDIPRMEVVVLGASDGRPRIIGHFENNKFITARIF